MKRILENKYYEDVRMTIGPEFGNKIIDINNHVLKLQIWDTVNQHEGGSILNLLKFLPNQKLQRK